jgi:hypothetical protein
MVSKKLVKVEVIQEGSERVLLRIYSDGSEEQTPIVRASKSEHIRSRIYWCWELGTGRRKFL